MTEIILPFQPKEYLVQGHVHCGAFTIKGVLSAFGRDVKRTPAEYNDFWIGKTFGLIYPKQMLQILNKHGLQTQMESATNLNAEEKLKLLKQKLNDSSPVILLIGNGYDTKGNYIPLAAKIAKHWVTLYGYDDNSGVFYEYDSCVKKENYNKDTPIGNIARTYKEVVRDWNEGTIPFVGSNIFITVKAPEH